MGRIRMILALLLCGLVMGMTVPALAGPRQDMLQEAEARFEHRGRPIHPGLVKLFETSLADRGTPVTVAVDVAAAHDTNGYPSDEVTKRGRLVGMKLDHGTYDYEHLGRLANGIHVVRTFASSGGSGIFQTLFLVRFSRGTGHDADGKAYPRLLMTVLQFTPLGDRSVVESRLTGNVVELDISPFPSGTSRKVRVDASGL